MVAEANGAEFAAVGADRQPSPPRWLLPLRNKVVRLPGGRMIWRIGVGVVGGAIVALGLLLVPLPGPGWAIVFLGLAVWATEFVWAQRLLNFARRTLRRWTDWALTQPRYVQGLIGLAGLAFLAALAYAGWRFVL
ncbi:TIGR02611 family protein [Jatrophihabitans sp. DSM 45814]